MSFLEVSGVVTSGFDLVQILTTTLHLYDSVRNTPCTSQTVQQMRNVGLLPREKGTNFCYIIATLQAIFAVRYAIGLLIDQLPTLINLHQYDAPEIRMVRSMLVIFGLMEEDSCRLPETAFKKRATAAIEELQNMLHATDKTAFPLCGMADAAEAFVKLNESLVAVQDEYSETTINGAGFSISSPCDLGVFPIVDNPPNVLVREVDICAVGWRNDQVETVRQNIGSGDVFCNGQTYSVRSLVFFNPSSEHYTAVVEENGEWKEIDGDNLTLLRTWESVKKSISTKHTPKLIFYERASGKEGMVSTFF